MSLRAEASPVLIPELSTQWYQMTTPATQSAGHSGHSGTRPFAGHRQAAGRSVELVEELTTTGHSSLLESLLDEYLTG